MLHLYAKTILIFSQRAEKINYIHMERGGGLDIIKLCSLAITGALAAVMLKKQNPSFAMLVSVATGIVLTMYALGTLHTVVNEIGEITDGCGIDRKYFVILLKIIAASYILEISSELCRDAGECATAAKIEMVGKLFIMFMSMPLVKSFLEVCTDAVNML